MRLVFRHRVKELETRVGVLEKIVFAGNKTFASRDLQELMNDMRGLMNQQAVTNQKLLTLENKLKERVKQSVTY